MRTAPALSTMIMESIGKCQRMCVCVFLKSPLLIMSTKRYTSGMFGQEISSTNKVGIMRPSNGLFIRFVHSPFDFLLHNSTLAIR